MIPLQNLEEQARVVNAGAHVHRLLTNAYGAMGHSGQIHTHAEFAVAGLRGLAMLMAPEIDPRDQDREIDLIVEAFAAQLRQACAPGPGRAA